MMTMKGTCAAAVALLMSVLCVGSARADDDAAGCLVMPWDASEERVGFNFVSNTSSQDVVVHWVYWSANCEKLADVTTCQTALGGDIQDVHAVTNKRWVNGESIQRGDPIDLRLAAESRGFPAYGTLYVSAYEAEAGQFLDCRPSTRLADDTIVGTSTVGDIPTGIGAQVDAEGFDVEEGRCVVPDDTLDVVTIQTFAPASLEFSSIIGHVTKENGGRDSDFAGELGPACARLGAIERPCVVVAQTDYIDNNEIGTSLPDVVFACSIQRSLLDSVTESFSTGGQFRFVQPMIVPTDLQLPSVPVGGESGTVAGAFNVMGLGNFGAGHRGWKKTTAPLPPEPEPTPTPCPDGTTPRFNPDGSIAFCEPDPTPVPTPTPQLIPVPTVTTIFVTPSPAPTATP